jgi:hypothetical protein
MSGSAVEVCPAFTHVAACTRAPARLIRREEMTPDQIRGYLLSQGTYLALYIYDEQIKTIDAANGSNGKAIKEDMSRNPGVRPYRSIMAYVPDGWTKDKHEVPNITGQQAMRIKAVEIELPLVINNNGEILNSGTGNLRTPGHHTILHENIDRQMKEKYKIE